jgi:hypothetical protein
MLAAQAATGARHDGHAALKSIAMLLLSCRLGDKECAQALLPCTLRHCPAL